MDLDKTRLAFTEHNCCQVYDVPKSKTLFLNNCITKINIPEKLSLKQEDISSNKTIVFFDPPWGNLSKMKDVTLNSFAYPLN